MPHWIITDRESVISEPPQGHEIRLVACEDAICYPILGSTLRGAFGSALKDCESGVWPMKTIASRLLPGGHGPHQSAHYRLLFRLLAGDPVMTLAQIVNMSLADFLTAAVD